MPYKVLVKNSAKPDLRRIKQPHLKEQFEKIAQTLKENPYEPTNQFEKLMPYSGGRYSRRLNYQHRIVYRVDEQAKEVYIYSAWTHYV